MHKWFSKSNFILTFLLVTTAAHKVNELRNDDDKNVYL